MWLAAGGVVLLSLLPPAYLLLRAAQAPAAAWAALLRPTTLAAIGRTGLLATSVAAACTAIALPLAWLTLRTDLPGRRYWLLAGILPLVLPSYIGAYLFAAALGPRGLLQGALQPLLGIERLPSIYGFPGAFLVLTLCAYPYCLLVIRASWQRLDPALEATARSLGLGPWQAWRRVTWPQLRPAVRAGALLVALYVFRDLGAVAILRYDTVSRLIYLLYTSAFDRYAAALLGLVLIVMAMVLVGLERDPAGRIRLHRSDGQGARPAPRVALGRWKGPALVFCAGLSFLALALPMSILLYWLWRGWQAGEPLGAVLPALRGSLLAAALATVMTLIAALPLAWLSIRDGGRAGVWLGRLSWISQALPPLVVALALVFASTQLAPALYQTLTLLVLAYVLLFLPEALSTLRTALRQIHPALGEAARTLGRGPVSTLREVILPLARPGLAAAAGLVFLTTLRELPATLILSPAGYATLSMSLWSAVSEAFFARAALPALILIAVSAPALVWINLRGAR